MRALALFALLVAIPARPALAAEIPAGPPLPHSAVSMIGIWRVGRDGEGARTCLVKLAPAPVIGGYRVVLGKGCRRAIDQAGDLYAWRPGGTGEIVFAAPTRQAVLSFHRIAARTYATAGSDDDRYLMVKTGR